MSVNAVYFLNRHTLNNVINYVFSLNILYVFIGLNTIYNQKCLDT